jgi:hypothetical protein
VSLAAAVGAAAGFGRRGAGLARADECAGESSLDLRRKALDIESALREKRTGVLDLIHAPRVDLDVLEARRPQL